MVAKKKYTKKQIKLEKKKSLYLILFTAYKKKYLCLF